VGKGKGKAKRRVFDDELYYNLLWYLGKFYKRTYYSKHNYKELCDQDQHLSGRASLLRRGLKFYHDSSQVWVSRYCDGGVFGLVIQSELRLIGGCILPRVSEVDFFLLSKLLKRVCGFLKKRGVGFVKPVIQGGRCCVQVFIKLYRAEFEEVEILQPIGYRVGVDYFGFKDGFTESALKVLLDI
jgi:hypothetical protein